MARSIHLPPSTRREKRGDLVRGESRSRLEPGRCRRVLPEEP
jgi:hypothetical protein